MLHSTEVMNLIGHLESLTTGIPLQLCVFHTRLRYFAISSPFYTAADLLSCPYDLLDYIEPPLRILFSTVTMSPNSFIQTPTFTASLHYHGNILISFSDPSTTCLLFKLTRSLLCLLSRMIYIINPDSSYAPEFYISNKSSMLNHLFALSEFTKSVNSNALNASLISTNPADDHNNCQYDQELLFKSQIAFSLFPTLVNQPRYPNAAPLHSGFFSTLYHRTHRITILDYSTRLSRNQDIQYNSCLFSITYFIKDSEMKSPLQTSNVPPQRPPTRLPIEVTTRISQFSLLTSFSHCDCKHIHFDATANHYRPDILLYPLQFDISGHNSVIITFFATSCDLQPTSTLYQMTKTFGSLKQTIIMSSSHLFPSDCYSKPVSEKIKKLAHSHYTAKSSKTYLPYGMLFPPINCHQPIVSDTHAPIIANHLGILRRRS